MLKILKTILGKSETPRAFRERSQRIQPLHSESFLFSCAEGDLLVRNISETGLGLEAPKKGALAVGTKLTGELRLENFMLPLTVEVRQVHKQGVGCLITSDRTELRRFIHRHFQIEIAAGKMSEVASSNLQEAEGTPRWFYSPDAYELYFTETGGDVQLAQVTFQGLVLEAKKDASPRLGKIRPFVEEEKFPVAQINRSQLVDWLPECPELVRKEVKKILMNIESLPAEFREKILKMI